MGKEGMVALAPVLAKLVNLTSLNLSCECAGAAAAVARVRRVPSPLSPWHACTTGIHRGRQAPPAHRGMHAHRLTVACMASVVRRVV